MDETSPISSELRMKLADEPPQPKTLRQDLDTIEDILLGPNGREVSRIICALRGPDYEDNRKLKRLTIWVRRTAFPRLAKMADTSPNQSLYRQGWDMRAPEDPSEHAKGDDAIWYSSHFHSHIRTAANALYRMLNRTEDRIPLIQYSPYDPKP